MAFRFMNRLRSGYGNIYTPHAGSMIIQVQRETGLANRTIVISERQVALLRVLGSRLGVMLVTAFAVTWVLFAVQSLRIPLLSGRIAELERDNRRIDSLQVALSRMHGRYDQVRHMLAAAGVTPPGASPADAPSTASTASTARTPSDTAPVARTSTPNAKRNATPTVAPNEPRATAPDSAILPAAPGRSGAR